MEDDATSSYSDNLSAYDLNYNLDRQLARRGREEEQNDDEEGEEAEEEQQDASRIVPHPRDSLVIAEMGYPIDPAQCWLCQRGSSRDANVNQTSVDHMLTTYLPRRGQVRDTELAKEMADFFEYEIRRPANQNRMPGEVEIPPLDAGAIFWHMRLHFQNPSAFLLTIVETMNDVMTHLRYNGLYRRVGPGENDIVVNQESFKMFQQAASMSLRTYTADPRRMIMHSEDHAIPTNAWINPIRPASSDDVGDRRDNVLFRQ